MSPAPPRNLHISPPNASITTLRDINGLAFMHRERARFRAGTSELLGLEFSPNAGEGIIVDVAAVEELRTVRSSASGIVAGAFAPVERLVKALPDLIPADASATLVRVRLALLHASVQVAGLGSSRKAAIDALLLAPHELPTLIEIPPPRPGLGCADRRRVTTDGAASFTLVVSVALRISPNGRFESVRLALDLDGTIVRLTRGEEKLENQRADPSLFPEVGRLATLAIATVDERTSSAARALTPLVVAILRDAFERARQTRA